MRMTNKIMQNNSLYNINQNKLLQDKLSTQMSTQKQLTRPSDDPVVAIRALRLRTSVSELTQYYKKNAPDAESWLKVTSEGLGTVTDVLTDLTKQANKASNKDLTADDLDIIITQMNSLTDEFYSTGNLDYAGRFVFTGYRTDTPMSFTTADVSDNVNEIPEYKITEQTTINVFDSYNYTFIDNLGGTTPQNYQSHRTVEQNVQNGDIHRLRLAYDNLSGDDAKAPRIEVMDDDNMTVIWSKTPDTVPLENDPDPYKQILDANNANPKEEKVIFVPKTGEVLFSDASYAQVEAQLTNKDTQIRATYTKEKWENGDLRPEHYFACTSTDKNGKVIDYNPEYLQDKKEKQIIAYDVGYNQTIDVNSTADEIFTHALIRDMDDLNNILNDLKGMSEVRKNLTDILNGLTEGTSDYIDTQKQLDAASKAYEYIRQSIHDRFGNTITKVQGYLDNVNVASTDNATRSSRLDLISNRLMEQQTTFRTLQSENEDVDIAEVAVELTSAELTYESSLMATSKIMQTTLMNYI